MNDDFLNVVLIIKGESEKALFLFSNLICFFIYNISNNCYNCNNY